MSVTNASAVIVPAAAAGILSRPFVLFIPPYTLAGILQTYGIHINYGAAATVANFYLTPGFALQLNSVQEVRALRAAALLIDVSVSVLIGTIT